MKKIFTEFGVIKRILLGITILTLVVGAGGLCYAIPFTDNVDFDDNDTGYREFNNAGSYTHTLLGLTTPPFTLDDAHLELRHNGNSNNSGEVWFVDIDSDNSMYIARLSDSRGSTWTTEGWDLSATILEFMDNGTPWALTVYVYDTTTGTDKIKIDYSLLTGNYTEPNEGRPVPEPNGGSPVPEPTTILLLGAGLVGLPGFRRKFFEK